MPFEEIETINRHNAPPQTKLSYMRNTSRKGGQPKPGAKPQLRISIPTTLCGTAKAKHFVLQIGTGGDAGKIRVAGVPAAGKDKKQSGVEPTELMHAFVFKFGYVPKLGDDIFEDHCAVKKISDDIFEIEGKASWFS